MLSPTQHDGKLDEHNRLSNDLRFDVGIDCELAKRAGGFIPLELIYEAAMEKTGGVPFHQYAKQNYRSLSILLLLSISTKSKMKLTSLLGNI